MKKSIKINYIFRTIYTILNIVFPLIYFPYVSRVLTVQGMGQIAFATSVVTILSSVAIQGIPVYAARHSASFAEDNKRMKQFIIEIGLIYLITITISIFLLVGLIGTINKIADHQTLIWILFLQIPLTAVGMDWYFIAKEEFVYITVRNFIFKVFSILAIFLFVKNTNDIYLYAFLSTVVVCGSSILNLYRVISDLSKEQVAIELKQHIMPLLSFLIVTITGDLIGNIGTLFLSFLENDSMVGYYGLALRVKMVVFSFISSLSTVILPRLAFYYSSGNTDKIKNLIRKNINYSIIASFYFIGYSLIYTKEIVMLLGGESYLGAIPSVRVILLSIFALSMTSLLNSMMAASGQEKKLSFVLIIGCIINFGLNSLLIPLYSTVGAALSFLCGEVVMLLVLVWIKKEELLGTLDMHNTFKGVVSFSVASIISYFTYGMFYVSSPLVHIAISGLFYTFIYVLCLKLLGEKIYLEIERVLLSKFSKRKNSIR